MKRAPLQLRHSVPIFRPAAACERRRRDMAPLWVVLAISLAAWAAFVALCWWAAGLIYPGT